MRQSYHLTRIVEALKKKFREVLNVDVPADVLEFYSPEWASRPVPFNTPINHLKSRKGQEVLVLALQFDDDDVSF